MPPPGSSGFAATLARAATAPAAGMSALPEQIFAPFNVEQAAAASPAPVQAEPAAAEPAVATVAPPINRARFIIDPPLGGWGAPETDRISILFAVLAGAMAATGGAIVAIHGAWTATFARLVASASFGLLACVGAIMLFPDLTDGLSQGAADVDTRAMWGHINEMKPVTTFESMLRHLLTEVHRQAADNPIVRMSMIVREGGRLAAAGATIVLVFLPVPDLRHALLWTGGPLLAAAFVGLMLPEHQAEA